MNAILIRPGRILQIAAALFPLVAFAASARADIFQWVYINPADPSQGKRQSSTLAPDGAGVDAVPGADLRGRNLSMAYLIGADLSGADFSDICILLDGCIVVHTDLTDADFTGAEVRGARFEARSSTPVISLAQLYSTGSYQAYDLTGIDLAGNDLSGANFAGQNLTNASFWGAGLWDADFTDADIRGTVFIGFHGRGISLAQLYSTASYQSRDLTGIAFVGNYLNNANFAGQNLTNADFTSAYLTDADFTGAEVRGTQFGPKHFGQGNPRNGITPDQLYSTASYQARDLTAIELWGMDLSGWSFAGQNLTNARFESALTGTDFTAADVRGAEFKNYSLSLAGANTTNLIRPAGNIDGLDLDGGALLVVRDDDIGSYHNPSWPPIPITIDQHLTMGPGGTLRMVFEADAWDSTISFAPGIPVTLGGTLELTFADDVNPASQLGRTFDLFDWTGVTPTGAFAISSPYAWDLSNLYTTGQVTLTAIPEPGTLLLASIAFVALFALRRCNRRFQIAAALLPLFAFASDARADIFQWEYINPADPSQGKRQSTTLAPDGAGVDAVPGADLSYRDLTMAYLSYRDLTMANLIGADLMNAYGYLTNLTNADLSQANLTNAVFDSAALGDADFTGAEVRGATFDRELFFDGSGFVLFGTGMAPAQLYSTASYQAHDLSGVHLGFNNLMGGNFAGQNLTNASFVGAILTGADFTDAEVRGATFSKVADHGTGITLAQLYSTASYRAHDLSGVGLALSNLAGANFARQNLTNATFRYATLTDADFTGANVGGADLTGANFREANLANANFGNFSRSCDCLIPTARLTYADLTGADARGASVLNTSDAVTNNLIRPDGHINGIELDADDLLVVRDYDGKPVAFPEPIAPIPITVDQHLSMGPGGTLRMVFEADAWDSTISFAPGIPVTLGGTLELTFAEDVNLASQIGRTFDLFDWSGVTPTGAFAISSPYRWDLSNLYTTGKVTLTAVPEPGALFLFSFGWAVVFLRRRGNGARRRRGTLIVINERLSGLAEMSGD